MSRKEYILIGLAVAVALGVCGWGLWAKKTGHGGNVGPVGRESQTILNGWKKVQPGKAEQTQEAKPSEVTSIETPMGKLVVGKGAVAEPVKITVAPYANGWQDKQDALVIGAKLAPDGLVFQEPVLLTLQLPAALPAGAVLRMSYAGTAQMQSDQELPLLLVAAKGAEGQAALRHFSEYSVSEAAIMEAAGLACFKLVTVADKRLMVFEDFKTEFVNEGDKAIFTFKGMSDATSRKECFKYALRQALLQDKMSDTETVELATSVADGANRAVDFFGSVSEGIGKSGRVVKLSSGYRDILAKYRAESLKWSSSATLTAAHKQLWERLSGYCEKAGLGTAVAGVSLSIGDDVLRALYVRSIDEELIKQRMETLDSAFVARGGVPPEVMTWLREVKQDIKKEREDRWNAIGRQLQDGATRDLVLPLADIVNRIGQPILSSHWGKVAGKLGAGIGVAIQVAETLAKINDMGWMVGRTTALATLALEYLPPVPESTVPGLKDAVDWQISSTVPGALQMRAYLLCVCFDLYAQAYEGDIIDHGVRYLIGSIQDLLKLGAPWSETRLQYLKGRSTKWAEQCAYEAAQMRKASSSNGRRRGQVLISV